MQGHLHIHCAPDSAGRSSIRRQSFRAPMHLSKPHLDGDTLVVNLVNPTAGLFGGDEVDIQCSVAAGASLALTTPAAGRVFKSRDGSAAVVRQEFRVAAGGFLEYYPELFIPHAGARYHQCTTLHAEPGAQLIFCEWLAPGRVAAGESFGFASLEWDTDFHWGTVLAARERYTLSPEDTSLAALRLHHPQSHYIGVIASGLEDFPMEEVEGLHSPQNVIGWSSLAVPGAWTIKALCGESVDARRCLAELRRILHRAIGRHPAALRRF